ncbi:hypothetical protein [Lysinibacillus pakistanensis]|uniref:Uncharacterized protein n=1 Tax=Lysinibacillus pakistanensis TaxID=759811 RepID=A0ABX6D7G9_9BACI|nr:hypothetical protein GDS87_07180 [Lysinibacillus pakistanensis]
MAIVGGNLEQKEIGLTIGVSGTHRNTEIDEVTGHLRLAQVDADGSGNPIYAEEGTWISKVINLEDKFLDFEKVVTTHTINGASSFTISTRTSDNSMDWSEWTAITADGTIQSETKQYIQVKIDLFAGFVTDVFKISNSDFEINEFVETSNNLRLKSDYQHDMIIDSKWTDVGSLHRKKVTRDEWMRIDKLNVVVVKQ